MEEISSYNNELLQLIRKIAIEKNYDKKIAVLINKEFYSDGCVLIKFKKNDEWDVDKNQIKFLSILQDNARYNELVNLLKRPPLVDMTNIKNG